MKSKPGTIDVYLAPLPGEQRAALERLRQIIRAAAPEAVECISYGLPAFELNGKLVAFGAAAKHCAFYPMSTAVMEAHEKNLDGYSLSKGTIRFQPERPLPEALVRKLVRARVAENTGRRGAPAKPRSRPARLDPAVSALLEPLNHPLAKELGALRRLVLEASPAIREAVKWSRPSYCTTIFFATINHVPVKDFLEIVLHTGAKKQSLTMQGRIDDPAGLIKWAAPDRAVVRVTGAKQLSASRAALQALVRQWIEALPAPGTPA